MKMARLAQVKSLGSTTEQGQSTAGKMEPNGDAYIDINMRDVATQTALQETVSAEQGGSTKADGQSQWVGRWEPLEDHWFRKGARVRLRYDSLPHRLKLRGIPAGENGTYLGMMSSGHCSVRYDNWTKGSVLDELEDFEAWIPRFANASIQTGVQDSGSCLPTRVDQGGSSTEAVACKSTAAYTKLLLDCQTACDGLRWQLNVAAWPPPHDDQEKISDMGDMLRRIDQEVEQFYRQLQRYHCQELCDSYTQTC